MATFIGRPYIWQAWSALSHGIRTGDPAFPNNHGMDVWQYRASNPMESGIFDAAMTALAQDVVTAVVAAFDFADLNMLVSAGGYERSAAEFAALFNPHPYVDLRGCLRLNTFVYIVLRNHKPIANPDRRGCRVDSIQLPHRPKLDLATPHHVRQPSSGTGTSRSGQAGSPAIPCLLKTL